MIEEPTVNTAFLMMAQYNGAAIIPLERVCADYFSHLTPEKFQQKVLAGVIDLPIVRMERSQKTARGIHLADLAKYIDDRREEALEELRKLRR